MSIVDVDFGVASILKKGNLVRVQHAYFPDGEEIIPDPYGIVIRVNETFRWGAIAGQARFVDVAIPWDDEEPEESRGWFILSNVSLSDLTRMLGDEPKETKPGQILPFQCKADADRV